MAVVARRDPRSATGAREVASGKRPVHVQRQTATIRGAAILSQHAHTRARPGSRPQPTAAERTVAQLLPIEADPANARRARDSVPLWFHTFCLNRAAEIYTPGVARDHRYRLAALPDSFAGQRVLDVGTFDGLYAFLAEARGAERVVAVDNEQYRLWVKARWGVELAGGEGFRAISGLLDSQIEYRHLDAFDLETLHERFDVIYCWGILHRVKDPLGLLRILRARLADGGRVLLETYGVTSVDSAAPRARAPGEVYRNDDHVYWGFTAASLAALAAHAGFAAPDVLDTPVIDGHPRILATLDLDVSTRT